MFLLARLQRTLLKFWVILTPLTGPWIKSHLKRRLLHIVKNTNLWFYIWLFYLLLQLHKSNLLILLLLGAPFLPFYDRKEAIGEPSLICDDSAFRTWMISKNLNISKGMNLESLSENWPALLCLFRGRFLTWPIRCYK